MPQSPPFFLSISDLHFNPCYDATLVKKLAGSDGASWEDVFRSSSILEVSTYGNDTNYPLLNSLFEDLKKQSNAAFVLFSGDFLGHRLREKYQSASKDDSEAGFKAFITKTVCFLSQKFQKTFPGKVIFPAIGNDDNFCGDYEITPMGDFLKMFTQSWQAIMAALAPSDSAAFAATFPMGGYYTALLPGLANHRLIVLNNIFMSQNYRDVCGARPGDPAAAQLAWLEWIFYQCRANRETVWLIFHEPIGINMYPALRGKDPHCAQNISTFIKSKYSAPLTQLFTSQSDLIQTAFCGHTHMDEFRILHDGENAPLMSMHITPSVSPVFGNNPAYQVFFIGGKDQAPVDYVTRSLNIETSPSTQTAVWNEEYCFSKTYGQVDLSPTSLAALRTAIKSDSAAREAYIRYYAVDCANYSLINRENWNAFYDAIWDNTREEFVEDYCPPHQSSTAGRQLITRDT